MTWPLFVGLWAVVVMASYLVGRWAGYGSGYDAGHMQGTAVTIEWLGQHGLLVSAFVAVDYCDLVESELELLPDAKRPH